MISRLRIILVTLLAYSYDFFRFIRFAHIFTPTSRQSTRSAHIYRISHALEKGMALREPRPGFGREKTIALLKFIDQYIALYGIDRSVIVGYCSIKKLHAFHNQDQVWCTTVAEELGRLEQEYPQLLAIKCDDVGNRILKLSDISQNAPVDPERFFNDRCSVRQFKKAAQVPEELLQRAAKIAQKAPSVCNRQSGRLHLYTDKQKIERILKLQDGNTGFGNECGALAVITADLSCFYKVGERNQAFVDGGLFAMTFAYALHALSVGTCFLNWSMGMRSDLRMRELLKLPENEVIITLLAIGALDDEFVVARSPRRELAEVYHLNEELNA